MSFHIQNNGEDSRIVRFLNNMIIFDPGMSLNCASTMGMPLNNDE